MVVATAAQILSKLLVIMKILQYGVGDWLQGSLILFVAFIMLLYQLRTRAESIQCKNVMRNVIYSRASEKPDTDL